MSFVGKILIVCQVVLSFCFMAFAAAIYTAQINWKEKSESTTADLETERNNRATDDSEHKKIVQEMQGKMEAAQNAQRIAEAALQQKTIENQTLTDTNKQLRTEMAVYQNEAGLAQDQAGARRDESLAERAINRELNESQRTLLKQLRDARDKLFASEQQMKDMERKQREALEEIANWRLIAQANNWVKDPKEYARGQAPPPVVRGYVIETRKADARGSETLVEISLGQRDGLVAGHELAVYRPASLNGGQGKYLGRIRLLDVDVNTSVGKIIEKAKNGIIQKDDHVTTQL